MFWSLMGLGFLVGLRHALDLDHVAAVASITSQLKDLRLSIRHGLTWGLGHTLTLFLFSLLVLLVDTIVPETLANGLEFVVGAMLVLLGLDVLRRVKRQRLHIHVHRHDDRPEHAHFHTHEHGESHHHMHPPLWRTLVVGLVHGMAGSAALILLTLSTVDSLEVGLFYILCFGLGSMIGMGLLSVAMSLPFLLTEGRLAHLQYGLQNAVGVGTVIFGGVVMWETGSVWIG